MLPVTFDEWHFTLVNSTVHSCLLQFKFRPNAAVSVIPRSPSVRRGDSTNSPVVGTINPFAVSGATGRPVESPPSLAHLLFPPSTVGMWDNSENLGRVADT